MFDSLVDKIIGKKGRDDLMEALVKSDSKVHQSAATRKATAYKNIGEGIEPNFDKDDEDTQYKKLTEQFPGKDPNEEAAPEEGDKVNAPNVDDDLDKDPKQEGEETDKEYFGAKGDKFYYLLTGDQEGEGEVEGENANDLSIVDDNGEVIFSAKENDLDTSDVFHFMIEAVRATELEGVSVDLFLKYVIPAIEELEQGKKEEEDPFAEEQTPGFEHDRETKKPLPDYNKQQHESKQKGLQEIKVTVDRREFDANLRDDGTMDTVIEVNGREFRFDSEFASYYREKDGSMNEDGLRELTEDALSELDEQEFDALAGRAVATIPSEERHEEPRMESKEEADARKIGEQQAASIVLYQKSFSELDEDQKADVTKKLAYTTEGKLEEVNVVTQGVKQLKRDAKDAAKAGDYTAAAKHYASLDAIHSALPELDPEKPKEKAAPEPAAEPAAVAEEGKIPNENDKEEKQIDDLTEEEKAKAKEGIEPNFDKDTEDQQYKKLTEGTHYVTRDGKELFRGSPDQCFEWILDNQSQSVNWAMKHEGYDIVPVSGKAEEGKKNSPFLNEKEPGYSNDMAKSADKFQNDQAAKRSAVRKEPGFKKNPNAYKPELDKKMQKTVGEPGGGAADKKQWQEEEDRQAEGGQIIVARVTPDGYMTAAATPAEYTGSERYWSDYYDSDNADEEMETIYLEHVPEELAQHLLTQGTSEQWFGDGYRAWDAANKYIEPGTNEGTEKPSQEQMFRGAQKNSAEADKQFLELVKDGLTREELKFNMQRRPELWSRWENWLPKLPSERDKTEGKELHGYKKVEHTDDEEMTITDSEKVNEDFEGDPNEEFIRHYVMAMLWSSTGDDEEPLENTVDINDIPEETQQKISKDAADFLAAVEEAGLSDQVNNNIEQAGHDFWLTRNGHGAGFWDRDVYDEEGADIWAEGSNAKKLTAIADKFGQQDPYIGDDELLYLG